MRRLIKSKYVFLLVCCSSMISTMERTIKETKEQVSFNQKLNDTLHNNFPRYLNIEQINLLLKDMKEILNRSIEEYGVRRSFSFFDQVEMQITLSVEFIKKFDVSSEDKREYLLVYYRWITSLIEQLIIFTQSGVHHEFLRLFDRICIHENKAICIRIYNIISDALGQYTQDTQEKNEIERGKQTIIDGLGKACNVINERKWPTYIPIPENQNEEKREGEQEAQLVLVKTQGKQENGRNKLPLIPIAITGVGLGLVIGLKKVLENTQYREQLITLWGKVPTFKEVKRALFTEFPRTIIEHKRKALLIGLLSTTGFLSTQYLVTKPEGLQERRYQKMTQWMHNKYNAAKNWLSSWFTKS